MKPSVLHFFLDKRDNVIIYNSIYELHEFFPTDTVIMILIELLKVLVEVLLSSIDAFHLEVASNKAFEFRPVDLVVVIFI